MFARGITVLLSSLFAVIAVTAIGGNFDCAEALDALNGRSESLFAAATRLEREGKTEEAKALRLELAKRVLARHGIEWPSDLGDREAADLLWSVHRMPRERGPGRAGAMAFFRQRLAPLREKFGAKAAKELLRRGVCGDDTAFLVAMGQSPGDVNTMLVYADFLEETDRPASSEYMRAAARRLQLMGALDTAGREALIAVNAQLAANAPLARRALYEWFETSEMQDLQGIGALTMSPQTGLPVLRPRRLDLLANAPEDVRRTVLSLDLTGFSLEPNLDLSHLGLPNLLELRLENSTLNHGSGAALQAGAFPSLRHLFLRNTSGANAFLRGAHGSQLPHLMELAAEGLESDALAALPGIQSPALRYLTLNGSRGNSTNMQYLSGWNLPELRFLMWRSGTLSNGDVTRMPDWRLPALRYLDLNQNPLGAASLQTLAMWRLPALEELSIAHTHLVGPEVAAWNLPRLRNLWLGGATVTDEGIGALRAEMELGALRRVRFIGLSQTSTSEPVRTALQEFLAGRQ